MSAFKEFGMQVFDMTEENFLFNEEWDVFRFGRNPSAIDIMTKMETYILILVLIWLIYIR